MAILTYDNLNPAALAPYDYRGWRRADKLFQSEKVSLVEFNGTRAICLVQEPGDTWTVTLTARTRTTLIPHCECPQYTPYQPCVHVLAAATETMAYLNNGGDAHWKYRLLLAGDAPVPAKRARSTSAVVFGLTMRGMGSAVSYISLEIYQIKSSAWPEAQRLAEIDDPAERAALLDRDRSWTRRAERVMQTINASQIINLPPEGVYLANLLRRYETYYYGISNFTDILPTMAHLHLPVFRIDQREKWGERLYFSETPIQIEVTLDRQADGFRLAAGMNFGDEPSSAPASSIQLLASDPAWALAGNQVRPVENPHALDLLDLLPVEIPMAEADEFREQFLLPLANRVEIRGDVITYQDIQEDPVPRLYLTEDAGKLHASLRFAYGEYEVAASPKAGSTALVSLPEQWGFARIQRDLAREDQALRLLSEARYGLKRAVQPAAPGTFDLRARTHPLDFLTRSIPALTQAGFSIFGEEKLKLGRINRSIPVLSLHISSGIDWFDIQAVVRYGEQEVPFKMLRSALKKNERYVKLADGSIGQIPEEWLTRYKKLFALAEDTDTGLRVRDFQLPLVDILLADAQQTTAAADFERRRERLRNLTEIKQHPAPRGLVGELRPYQQAGVDWLHFLRDSGFGGCLADDMGLGKTIQVLALLQSLKEDGKLDGPALLVAPKSLMTNWQREAERFTPDLRVMIYTGPGRKEAVDFAAHDMVLTTYGILLRDIERLRQGPFAYAILDESQNIKNPLSQSAKAARLLNAPHRLVLTGTPVENNTFELWSQFAFLNPGLLGGQDSFKREFAGPIESQSDPEAATLLRRLIHPFILRRTKQQVAPELPPRTERVLLVDFEPAQRKLYQQTRDYYRSSLLGVIEESGMGDARMKILEGLLRLRQISIHPALVDPNYTGDSPKFQLLLDTLETLRAEGHKALIFSQFVQTLRLLEKELAQRQIRYTYLDGGTDNRQERVDLFQTDPTIPFFLISLKAGGVGLNLTAADYVIHLDPWWNPAVEMQAADRAHRIGQDKPVFIYKLIARGSVEEKILKLQERKRELVDQIISAESSFFKSITKEDVQALFS